MSTIFVAGSMGYVVGANYLLTNRKVSVRNSENTKLNQAVACNFMHIAPLEIENGIKRNYIV